MQVSVIIPVYKASRYVEEAVQSALAQPETREVILVEDGSDDESLSVCEALSRRDPRIRVMTHPGNANRGPGASRNLGMQHASSELIAFLDADDVYLPGRFSRIAQILDAHPDAMGVYEIIGVQYETPDARTQHLDRTYTENTGMRHAVAPDDLFSALARGTYGHIHLNGFTIRRTALTSELHFDENLRQCEDSDWFFRLSRKYRLYCGSTTQPVALRRVHGENSVLNKPVRIRYQRKFLRKCIDRHFYGSQSRIANAYVVARYVSWSRGGFLRHLGVFSRPMISFATCIYCLAHPTILYKIVFPKRGSQE